MIRNVPWSEWEAWLHADPARRGLATVRDPQGRYLDDGQLRAACENLAQHARHVGIVTGFYVAGPAGPTIETDGPPGALYLATALRNLGIGVTLLTDAYGEPALRAACERLDFSDDALVVMPFDAPSPAATDRQSNSASSSGYSRAWCEWLLTAGPASQWSHLISIERCGPSHTLESLRAQSRDASAPEADFLAQSPQCDHDRCHNMRGVDVTPYMAKTHLLFDTIADRRLPIKTLGIADGGNELGAGCLPWELIARHVPESAGARIACRVACDNFLLAGVSNWGAYAVALGVAALRDRLPAVEPLGVATERCLLEFLADDGGVVDGITRRCEPTVDGLALDVYLEPLARMRRSLGMPE